MGLIRSLNTGVSGLEAQQYRIEVVGNNIANVDTTGFKASRTEFSAMLSQLETYGMPPNGFLGGIDPIQVGLGVRVGSTPKDFTQGPIKNTGVASDLAITGDGFFTLRNGDGKAAYTRDGTFGVSAMNLLYDPSSGNVVQGYKADKDFTVNPGGPITDLEIPIGVLTIAQATQSATIEGNLNSTGPVASSGTRILSEMLYDSSRADGSLISASNPLGFERADSTSRLQDLVRSLNDYTAFSGSSAGTAGSYTRLFPDLQTSPVGLKIELQAQKGGRTLPDQTFVVGDRPPVGGSTLGELVSFIQGSLGITDGTLDGARSIEHTYSFIRTNPVTGYDVGGTMGASDSLGLASISGPDMDFRGVQVGDFIRFISGQASGQIAEVQTITDSNADGIPDTLGLRTDGFNTLTQVPAAGDSWVIQAPAGVRIGSETTVATVDGAAAGSVSTSGAVSSFTITDASVTNLATERGVAVSQMVEYTSGGSTVLGIVAAVSGNTATISFSSGVSQDPAAGTAFTFRNPASGSIEISGNVGTANGIGNLQLLSGGSLVPIFAAAALETAAGESLTTTVLAYDSLGTPRELNLTLVYQSSTTNGPNVFRYFAESADDTDKNRIVGSGTVLFDANGQFLGTGTTEEEVTIDLAPSVSQPGGVETPFRFRFDFSRLTQFADGSQVIMRDQDGFKTGTLRDFAIADDGTIQGIFDNGLTRTLGQVAISRFANSNGLIDRGDNFFEESASSGVAQTGMPGTFGRGLIRGGSLEESNVDLAEQFTQLMIGQRAFQANAKTVSTSDQLLQELVQLL